MAVDTDAHFLLVAAVNGLHLPAADWAHLDHLAGFSPLRVGVLRAIHCTQRHLLSMCDIKRSRFLHLWASIHDYRQRTSKTAAPVGTRFDVLGLFGLEDFLRAPDHARADPRIIGDGQTAATGLTRADLDLLVRVSEVEFARTNWAMRDHLTGFWIRSHGSDCATGTTSNARTQCWCPRCSSAAIRWMHATKSASSPSSSCGSIVQKSGRRHHSRM